MTKPYPDEALIDIAKQLLDEWDLTLEQIGNLATDLPRECKGIVDDRAEAAWPSRQESLMESGGPDDRPTAAT